MITLVDGSGDKPWTFAVELGLNPADVSAHYSASCSFTLKCHPGIGIVDWTPLKADRPDDGRL